MDTSTTHQSAAALWDDVASGWSRFATEIEAGDSDLTARIRAATGPLDGHAVLELGSGAGELAVQIAEWVGHDGTVTASDVAPAMTEVQRTRLALIPNARVVGDVNAHDLPFPENTFDTVVFRMGLMMTSDPDRALRSIHRVLRPGGRFVTTTWGPFTENPWLTTVGMSAMSLGLVSGGPPIHPGDPFSLPDPDDLRRRFTEAGFLDVDVETLSATRHYRDTEEHVTMALSLAPPLAAAQRAMTAEQASALRHTVTGLTEQYRNSDGSLDVPMSAHIVVGTGG
ncbi:methyltransferase domain-containing protein [Gordonia sp. CPCC 205515]|uniref:class I SAM-dependent methyltransferase n=1 Tax=Gordonia sp. CPCC 205515 TaxID=3140791 RepID=UPI003AF35B0F